MLRVHPTCIALALLTASCRPAPERSEAPPAEADVAPRRPGEYAPPKERDNVPYERLTDICAAFHTNARSADARFKGRIVRFSCAALSVRDDTGADGPSVTLVGKPAPGTSAEPCQVECQFAVEHRAYLKRLSPGTPVTLQGRCAGLGRDGKTMAFVHCTVLLLQDLPLLRAAAADLSRAYSSEPTAADKKYRGKVVQFSYAIATAEPAASGLRVVFHPEDGKGASLLALCCWFGPEAEDVSELRAGKLVTVKGICAGAEEDGVVLVQCQMVKSP